MHHAQQPDHAGGRRHHVAYNAFQEQHPHPRLQEDKRLNTGSATRNNPIPPATGWALQPILLLAPYNLKHTTHTVVNQHTSWTIPKLNIMVQDTPPVCYDDQNNPKNWWRCRAHTLDIPWPLLHLLAMHYPTPTAAVPP